MPHTSANPRITPISKTHCRADRISPFSLCVFWDLGFFFALGVKGVGGVFRSRSRVSSSPDNFAVFGMPRSPLNPVLDNNPVILMGVGRILLAYGEIELLATQCLGNAKAEDIARTRRSSDWKRLSAGAGTKGPRLHDWCYLELADLEAEEFNSANQGLWTRGLLIRRHIADGDLAFFTTWCPAGTSIEALVAVEGHRWAIEDSFETAKNEFGLDHSESRSWHGWHRHVSMAMLAFAMMAAIRHRANPPPPKKTKRQTTAKTNVSPRRH